MGGACSTYGWEESCKHGLARKSEERRPLGKPRHKWEDIIKMDNREVGYGDMDLNDLAQDRERCRAFVKAVMNIRVPKNAGNFLASWKPVSFHFPLFLLLPLHCRDITIKQSRWSLLIAPKFLEKKSMLERRKCIFQDILQPNVWYDNWRFSKKSL